MLNFKGYYLKIKKSFNKIWVKKHLRRKSLSIKGFSALFQCKQQSYNTLHIELILAIELSCHWLQLHFLLNNLQSFEYI